MPLNFPLLPSVRGLSRLEVRLRKKNSIEQDRSNQSTSAAETERDPHQQWKWSASLGTTVIFFLACISATPPAAAEHAAVVFPTVTSDALDKQRITLPAGLEGEANLLLLSFSREQSNQLESWTAPAQALQHTNMHFHAYRIPVADPANALFRWWANASLKSEETDPQLWHWEVPIYVDKDAFRDQLGIADERSVVALLVDRSGRILWRATGTSTAESRAALMAAVTTPGHAH